MTIKTHILGYPRIGKQRELKTALEAYWRGELAEEKLQQQGATLRQANWQTQKSAQLSWVTAGDFAWYDHMLTTTLMLGCLPERILQDEQNDTVDLDTLFTLARGKSKTGAKTTALGLTKWFNTNYHYLVPELSPEQNFTLTWRQLFDEIKEAQAQGHAVKPVLVGPLSFLWLSKTTNSSFDKLDLLPRLLPVYKQILSELKTLGVEWVQIDEPILAFDLPQTWQTAFIEAYRALPNTPKRLLTSYFGSISHQLSWITELNIEGLHIDCATRNSDWQTVVTALPETWICSLGVIQGRNIWRTDLNYWYEALQTLPESLTNRLWLGTSCSLLHCPLDLNLETTLDAELKSWLAFAEQKCEELRLLSEALKNKDPSKLVAYSQPIEARKTSPRVNISAVQNALAELTPSDAKRNKPYAERALAQRKALPLPLLPTTTIGSFPQTKEIRTLRSQFKAGTITTQDYTQQMQNIIRDNITFQEKVGLDVLVHGEPERNDMVEYFGELLQGCAVSEFGWVQSYGSRCVKPPIIFGDIQRTAPMTCDWATYAQSQTEKPVKGMLTGPATLLCWSFPREDITRETIALQFALALRAEVTDLEARGIKVIQIDEPAFREGLPLREKDYAGYLNAATHAFRVGSCSAQDTTQIHTHMCYSDFNLILSAVADLDADVITIETSRSQMRLLEAFEKFAYPNEIGPGVYDVHSPNIPSQEWIVHLLEKAAKSIPVRRLWVNPDCGLKTRGWPETEQALIEMVNAAKQLRKTLESTTNTSEALSA